MEANRYSSKLFRFILSLQRDLAAKKISEHEFDFLLGLFLEKEFSDMVQKEINEMLPTDMSNMKSARLLTYEWKRVMNHAGA